MIIGNLMSPDAVTHRINTSIHKAVCKGVGSKVTPRMQHVVAGGLSRSLKSVSSTISMLDEDLITSAQYLGLILEYK